MSVSQHISNIETGKTKVSLSTFIKIVNELNIPPEMVLAECMKIDLLEIAESRCTDKSTIFCTQYEPVEWYSRITPTEAAD